MVSVFIRTPIQGCANNSLSTRSKIRVSEPGRRDYEWLGGVAIAHKPSSKPDNVRFEQAACAPVAGLPARQGLRNIGRPREGQKVLINGAAGGVGTFAAKIAKSTGAEVTGVCSAGNVELVRSLGADMIIDYRLQDFTRIRRLYDLLLDNLGNRTFAALSGIMDPRCRCVLAGAPKQLLAALARIAKAFFRPRFLPQPFTLFIAKIRNETWSSWAS